jgi:hypothetical protein
VSETETEPPGCACKVGRVQERYGLGRLDAELAARWTAPAGERGSLRELAREFNHRVARASHLRGAVRHHALGDTEYTGHRFCDAGCLREWVRKVRAVGGDIDWRADESW